MYFNCRKELKFPGRYFDDFYKGLGWYLSIFKLTQNSEMDSDDRI
jgi:hypothetical protein